MNNENNNFNNGQNINTVPVVPTTPVTNPVINNQINQTVMPNPAPAVQQPMPVPVEPSTVPVTEVPVGTQPQIDNNAMINENLQKVEINNYKAPSKFKVFVLFLFFVLLIVFIMFLPEISSYVRIYMSGTNNQQPQVEVVTTGKLVCTLTSNTSDLDKEYEFDFSFADSKLTKTKYIVYTRGDSTTESALDELNEKCVTLKETTKDLDGVSIRCEYTDKKLTETQVFELETVDSEKLNAAFTEAGGIVPTYQYNQSIDDIEKNMKASGYSCERQK